MVRTTCLGRGVESLNNFRVHLDGEPALHYELLIPGIHLVRNPVGENILEDWGTNISDPLLAYFLDLLPIRQVLPNWFMLIGKVCDIVEGESFVLWDGDLSDLRPVDSLLSSTDKVF